MHRTIGLGHRPLGAQKAGNTHYEAMPIQLVVVSLVAALRFGVILWKPELDNQVIRGLESMT